MSLSATIQAQIDLGLAQAGQAVGVPYSAYRVGPTSSGDFPSGWVALPTQPIYRTRVNDSKIVSALKSGGTLFYQIMGDMRSSILGDVFINSDQPFVNGQSYGAGATSVEGSKELDGFALAWHPAVESLPIGSRISARGQAYRLASGPVQLPDGSFSFDNDQVDRFGLVLANGVYSWMPRSAAAPSFIPIGVGCSERPSRNQEYGPNLPSTTPENRYYVYVPPLPGAQLAESDEIILEDGSRYVIVQPYDQQTGVVGFQGVADRKSGITR